MDPYIEACGFWEDFHHGLIARIADALSAKLPDNYIALTGERGHVVLVEPQEKKEPEFQPVWETGPVSLRPFIAEHFKESFVEIYALHPEERRLVTCIEILSPSNKRRDTEGWDLYLRKRQALLLGEASLIEIDLLRGGTKMPMLDAYPISPYTLLVSRRSSAPYCRAWPGHFQRPLPPIPVPLSEPDPDVTLELQPLIEAVYASGRSWKLIDYRKPLQPPLSDEENAWLQAQLQSPT
jgi:hypothetical protein